MRFNLQNEDLTTRVANLKRGIEELKAAQFTSQNSGMLGHLDSASEFDSFGDIVAFSTTSSPTPVELSEIPCPATASPAHFNSIICDQLFVPKNGKPAVAVPFMRLEVKSGGLHGESEFIVTSDGDFMLQMDIFNVSNVKVGEAFVLQQFGEYLEPAYDATTDYAWKSTIIYTCTQSFDLSYKLLVRSSDRGSTSSELRGLW